MALFSAFGALTVKSQSQRPNVVFILGDNIGYGDMGAYGGGQLRGDDGPFQRSSEAELFEEEIGYGVFERTLTLPEGVNVEKLTAEYVDGVLEITAPVTAAALPRKIEGKSTAPFVKQIAA